MGVVYNDAWLPLQNSQIYALIKISLETRLFAFKTIVIDLFSTEVCNDFRSILMDLQVRRAFVFRAILDPVSRMIPLMSPNNICSLEKNPTRLDSFRSSCWILTAALPNKRKRIHSCGPQNKSLTQELLTSPPFTTFGKGVDFC